MPFILCNPQPEEEVEENDRPRAYQLLSKVTYLLPMARANRSAYGPKPHTPEFLYHLLPEIFMRCLLTSHYRTCLKQWLLLLTTIYATACQWYTGTVAHLALASNWIMKRKKKSISSFELFLERTRNLDQSKKTLSSLADSSQSQP